jgi:hypothetical protein
MYNFVAIIKLSYQLLLKGRLVPTVRITCVNQRSQVQATESASCKYVKCCLQSVSYILKNTTLKEAFKMDYSHQELHDQDSFRPFQLLLSIYQFQQ